MARDVVMVNGLPGSGKSTLGPRLATTLRASYLSGDRIAEALADAVVTEVPDLGDVAMDTVWALAAAMSGTVVVDAWCRDHRGTRAGLARSGAAAHVEVWCDVPAEVARDRYVSRRRPAVHRDGERLSTEWNRWAAEAGPLGLGPVLTVDTSRPVDLDRLVSQVRATLWS